MKPTIVILMGGPSSEHDVSLSTGRAMQRACKNLGYSTLPIHFNHEIIRHLDVLRKADLVLIALHGGMGENGRIQGMLESLGIRYSGSDALSSAMCMDKHISKLLVKDIGIRTPKWSQLRKDDIDSLPKITYPCVVKPNSEGSTIGLTIVKKESKLKDAMKLAFHYDDEILIEDYIGGKELTVSIVGNDVLPIVEIQPTHSVYDYECKYTKGLTKYICPADLPKDLTEKIQKKSLKIFKLLKCRHYGRVDFRLDENNQCWFLEVNTLPGMTETSLLPKSASAGGMSFDQLIQEIITQSFNEV